MTALNPLYPVGNQIAEVLSCTRRWLRRRRMRGRTSSRAGNGSAR